MSAHARDVTVVGTFPGKAVITVDRGSPRTVAIGETINGVKLLAVEGETAVLEIDGKRRTLELGQHFETAAASGATGRVSLAADARGHYVTDGKINGQNVRMLVDTGATYISLPDSVARGLGIDASKGVQGISQTANGNVRVSRVKLDSVSVGGITLYQVDALVHGSDSLPVTLLGMSFLNRTEMRREGEILTLIKRF